MTQPLLQAADLRGGARLTPDAVAGLASLGEAMRARLASLPRRPEDGTPVPGQAARAVAAPAREPVHDVTRAPDGSAEALLGWLEPALTSPDPRQPPHEEHEAVVAALNGVLGDHLATTDSPLAITMAFRRAGRPLMLERLAVRSSLPAATPRLLVLLHDLCMNDLQWQRAGHDHGQALAREGGYTPIYLHYNSGLSVSTNGRILAQLMERLFDAWPAPLERLVMLGHGMGGLVARSALHHGALIQRVGLRWPTRVDDLVCLGTPHQGAPLDSPGHGVQLLLGAAPYAASLARLAKLRSAGINDLRLGSIVSGRATEADPHAGAPVALPAATRCFAIAASLGPAPVSHRSKPPDDGLVPVASALGQHPAPDRRLAFAADRQAVVPDTGHLDLLASPEVFGLLRQWLA